MNVLNTATPEGPKDIAVRAVKSGVASALGAVTLAAFTSLDGIWALWLSFATAAFSVVQNALLKWANS